MTPPDWSALGDDLLDDLFDGDVVEHDYGERYAVMDELGQGGQGTVVHGRDTALERDVAIKRSHTAEAGRWLNEESRLLSRLAHPCIPQVYERGTCPDGTTYIVLQLARGRRLDQVVPRDGLPWRQAIAVVRPIADAVGHAHGVGILHRDLKPENVLIDDQRRPMVVDWGLAATGDPRAICGSPNFAAPEQLDGQVADARADVYALGVLLYFVATGELPYGRRVRDFHEFRRMRAGLQQVPLRQRRPDAPVGLERIWRHATAAQPGGRYKSTADFIADLDALLDGRGLRIEPPSVSWRPLAVIGAVAASAACAFALGRWSAAASGPGPGPSPDTAPLPGPGQATRPHEDPLHQQGGASPFGQRSPFAQPAHDPGAGTDELAAPDAVWSQLEGVDQDRLASPEGPSPLPAAGPDASQSEPLPAVSVPDFLRPVEDPLEWPELPPLLDGFPDLPVAPDPIGDPE